MSDIKTYEMLVDDENFDGVYCISLVDSPAILTDYILLSKENKIQVEIQLEKLIDAKRKVVCGPALIPDIIIPRNGYDITFSKDTIRKISENFLIQNNKDNVNIQHKVSVNKVNLVESWIVDDTNKDKSAQLGYKLPVGTWMVSFKVNDENLWTEYIESGILKGFSIEGNFTQQEVQLHKHEHTDDMDILEIYLAINYSPNDLNSYYKWELSTKDNNCPACKKWSNEIKTLREWINTAIPGVPVGTSIAGLSTSYATSPYGTFCEDACGCKLSKVNSPDFKKKYIAKPW
jgi:hypothetical protein